MKYTEAEREFAIRVYRWAKPILAQEIEASFPSFRLCKDGPGETRRFMLQLDTPERLSLAQGLLQQRHAEAIEALGEPLSESGVTWVKRYYGIVAESVSPYSQELFARERAGEKLRFASKRRIRTAVAAQFKAAFGNVLLKPDPLEGNDGLVFRVKCKGWILKTRFLFGRYEPEIGYWHDVWTGKWHSREEPPVLPYNCLRRQISYGNEIGIGSVWPYLMDEDIEPTCAVVVEHCRRFFEAAPKLLEGLELETLTT